MDILTVATSSNPLSRTQFIDGLTWDYGPFLTFASRKGLLGKVPYVLRKPTPDLHIPYTEMLCPGAKEENESFYLSWFYFGLLAEFCGLNDGPAKPPEFSDDDLKSYRSGFYQQLIIIEEGKGYLNSLVALEVLDSILKAMMEADSFALSLIDHFTECLVFAFRMIGNIHSDVDDRILLSITAVGELLSATVRAGCKQMVKSSKLSGPKMGQAAIPWASEYNRRTSALRTKMVDSGWCPSEVERVVHAYQGLSSVCSLSALNRTASQRDHSPCTKAMCKAFQIDMKTYKLSHTEDSCSCSEYDIMIDEVQRILRETNSYPVLRFVASTNGNVKLTVEEKTPETKFVALSHVWADGLGNPKNNSIQQCQVNHLRTLLSKLQRSMEPDYDSSDDTQTYRLWIDTLCCPTELSGKLISLERIADVYRDATHVLVLDSSIYQYSSDSSPAEILLRIFGTSSWMRRLWTLQEGVLSKSLCFQLADRAVRDYDLYAQLEEAAKTDTRMFQISEDIYRELQQLHNFEAGQDMSNAIPFPHPLQVRLWIVQWSLYFRSVTVPSDEALCLATLLSLDIKPIAEAPTREDRMALVWQQVADRHGGIPPRVVFTEDYPIHKPGFRWAPLSLLGSSFESTISANSKAVRFDLVNMEASDIGVLTPLGLQVRFNGATLGVRPLHPNVSLHPWEGVIKPREDMLYIKQEATSKWFRIIDAELVRAQEIGAFSEERLEEWFRVGNRLCNGMHQQGAALIFDEMRMDTSITEHAQTMRQSIVVHIQDTSVGESPQALHVHTFRPVVIEQVGDKEATMVESLRHLAGKLAQDPATLKLQEAADRDIDGEEWKAAKEEVRETMKQVCMEFWDTTPQFAEAVGAFLGPDMREWVWAMIPKQFSHDILLQDLPKGQIWIVD